MEPSCQEMYVVKLDFRNRRPEQTTKITLSCRIMAVVLSSSWLLHGFAITGNVRGVKYFYHKEYLKQKMIFK